MHLLYICAVVICNAHVVLCICYFMCISVLIATQVQALQSERIQTHSFVFDHTICLSEGIRPTQILLQPPT